MQPTRREVLATMGTAGLLAGTGKALAQLPRDHVSNEDRITHGKIRQSVMGWCFKPMTGVTLAKHCRDIGLVAIELLVGARSIGRNADLGEGPATTGDQQTGDDDGEARKHRQSIAGIETPLEPKGAKVIPSRRRSSR